MDILAKPSPAANLFMLTNTYRQFKPLGKETIPYIDQLRGIEQVLHVFKDYIIIIKACLPH